jgi:pimeloyl-ACP methyl ester carboxylesterase
MATAHLNGIDIYYEEHGDANSEPVLLIMGFAQNASAWAPQIEALKPHYRVVAFDNRGAGRSTQPEGPYSIGEMLADTVALLDHVRIERAHVIGTSMGGMIAQELALQHPGRVRSLVLCCTSPGGPRSAGYERMLARSQEALDMRDIAEGQTPERIQQYALELFTPEFLANPGPGLQAMVVSSLQYPSTLAGVQGQMHAVRAHDTYDRLPSIAVPTLVMAGTDDVMVDAGNARILAERIPDAQLVMFEGQRHGFTAERPDEVNAEILRFLEERSAAAA